MSARCVAAAGLRPEARRRRAAGHLAMNGGEQRRICFRWGKALTRNLQLGLPVREAIGLREDAAALGERGKQKAKKRAILAVILRLSGMGSGDFSPRPLGFQRTPPPSPNRTAVIWWRSTGVRGDFDLTSFTPRTDATTSFYGGGEVSVRPSACNRSRCEPPPPAFGRVQAVSVSPPAERKQYHEVV